MCKKDSFISMGRGVAWLGPSQLVSITFVPKLKKSHAGFGQDHLSVFPLGLVLRQSEYVPAARTKLGALILYNIAGRASYS